MFGGGDPAEMVCCDMSGCDVYANIGPFWIPRPTVEVDWVCCCSRLELRIKSRPVDIDAVKGITRAWCFLGG